VSLRKCVGSGQVHVLLTWKVGSSNLLPEPEEDSYGAMNICGPRTGRSSASKRGSKAGVEVKGLIGTSRCPDRLSLAPHYELWCKWTSNDFLLDGTNLLVTKKVRWARKLDTSRNSVFEVPLGTDEIPLNGEWVQEGCNLTLTEVRIASVAGQWWTFCLEAFGSLESAPKNLQAATSYARSMSFPQANGAFLSYPAWLSQVAH
jgi:hypothetical protein